MPSTFSWASTLQLPYLETLQRSTTPREPSPLTTQPSTSGDYLQCVEPQYTALTGHVPSILETTQTLYLNIMCTGRLCIFIILVSFRLTCLIFNCLICVYNCKFVLNFPIICSYDCLIHCGPEGLHDYVW